MKVRDSGMPDETYWESLFDIESIMQRIGPAKHAIDAVEFGSGYGTFSLPIARRISGTLFALDLETELIHRLKQRAESQNVNNITAIERDFVASGTGLADASVDYACLFNILHHDEPVNLIREAKRVVRPGGFLAVMHWRSDLSTPRGPSLDIRPKPQQMLAWLHEAEVTSAVYYVLAPYHYGYLAKITTGDRI